MNYRRYRFRFKQTITTILARDDETYRKAVTGMMYAREKIEEYIALNPIFLTSLEPLECHGDVVERMCAASRIAGVGPMAAVAATVAWYGVERANSDLIVIDNGGDIVIKNDESITIGIYAGNRTSVGFEIEGNGKLKSVCTSSGKIGPSISFGFADAATIFSDNPALADAFATALGNRIKEDHGKEEITEVLEEFWEHAKKYVDGALVIKDNVLAYVGEIPELKTVKIEPDLITRG